MPDADWERRFVADPARAREAMEAYSQAGFDVRADLLTPEDLREECVSCRLVQAGLLRVIRTRRRS